MKTLILIATLLITIGCKEVVLLGDSVEKQYKIIKLEELTKQMFQVVKQNVLNEHKQDLINCGYKSTKRYDRCERKLLDKYYMTREKEKELWKRFDIEAQKQTVKELDKSIESIYKELNKTKK